MAESGKVGPLARTGADWRGVAWPAADGPGARGASAGRRGADGPGANAGKRSANAGRRGSGSQAGFSRLNTWRWSSYAKASA